MYNDNKIKVNTFEEAAQIVARDFWKTMKDVGFETFKEMAQCYWWEASDIRNEIADITEYETTAWFFDDKTYVVIDDEDMRYRDFKKLVMQYLDILTKVK